MQATQHKLQKFMEREECAPYLEQVEASFYGWLLIMMGKEEGDAPHEGFDQFWHLIEPFMLDQFCSTFLPEDPENPAPMSEEKLAEEREFETKLRADLALHGVTDADSLSRYLRREQAPTLIFTWVMTGMMRKMAKDSEGFEEVWEKDFTVLGDKEGITRQLDAQPELVRNRRWLKDEPDHRGWDWMPGRSATATEESESEDTVGYVTLLDRTLSFSVDSEDCERLTALVSRLLGDLVGAAQDYVAEEIAEAREPAAA